MVEATPMVWPKVFMLIPVLLFVLALFLLTPSPFRMLGGLFVILAVMGFFTYGRAVEQARQRAALENLRGIEKALRQFEQLPPPPPLPEVEFIDPK